MRTRRRERLALFVLLLSQWAQGAAPAETKDLFARVRARYAAITSLSATVDQTKSSPLLKRPLKSLVRLSLREGVIRWEVLSPVPATMILNGGSVTLVGSDGKEQPMRGGQEARQLFTLIEQIIKADWSGLAAACTVTNPGPRTLVLEPLPQAKLAFLKQLIFHFDENLDLKELSIVTPGESTLLQFRHLEWKGPR
jgi:outer membrane lipoprotein-sorting protein